MPEEGETISRGLLVKLKAAFADKGLLAASIIFLLVGLSYLLGVFSALYEKPNYNEMRKHAISRFNDDALKALYKASQDEYERENLKHKEDVKKFWELHSARQNKCAADVVYRERHPDECAHRPIFPPEPIFSSVDDVFERKLMGICLLITTVKEAKAIGCLPRP